MKWLRVKCSTVWMIKNTCAEDWQVTQKTQKLNMPLFSMVIAWKKTFWQNIRISQFVMLGRKLQCMVNIWRLFIAANNRVTLILVFYWVSSYHPTHEWVNVQWSLSQGSQYVGMFPVFWWLTVTFVTRWHFLCLPIAPASVLCDTGLVSLEMRIGSSLCMLP